MLTREDLLANFSGVTDITSDIVRCKDVLPKVTFFNYVRPARNEAESDYVLVSEGNPDDGFAVAVLSRAAGKCASSPNSQRLNTSGSYEEWTVKTPGVGNRGARRLVLDRQNQSAYYSDDHYDSFIDVSKWVFP
jgi:hypothetical protein